MKRHELNDGDKVIISNGTHEAEGTISIKYGKMLFVTFPAADDGMPRNNPNDVLQLRYYKKDETFRASEGHSNGKYPKPYIVLRKVEPTVSDDDKEIDDLLNEMREIN